jgi:hydrogenase maturation protease
MLKTLIIGFGNLDRADDGVAFYVINALRRRIGQTPLSEDVTGLENLGNQVDAIFLAQLAPELVDIMKDYDEICFVDAHVYEEAEDLHCTPVIPEEAALTFTHHMTPAMLLALLQALYQHQVAGYLVSIRGYDFDFHRDLSSLTQGQMDPAVQYIMQRIGLF